MSDSESTLTTRLVVGVDFKETGDRALVTAIRLARRLPGCELHPVHVLPPAPGKEKLDQLDEALTKAGQVLEDRARFAARGLFGDETWDQHTVLHVRVGDPAEAIHQVAVDMSGDLIIVGHADKGLVEKLRLGSVSEKLLRIARVPVMVSRQKDVDALDKTDWPEPSRDGEVLEGGRGWSRSAKLAFGGRSSHIAGML